MRRNSRRETNGSGNLWAKGNQKEWGMKRGGIKGKLLTLNKRKQDDRRKGCWEEENREGEAREGGTIRKRGKGGDVGQPRWEGGSGKRL